jgi:hypothetical protein
MIVMVVKAMNLLWFLDRKLKRFELVPGIENAYDTARDRVIANLFYASGFVLLLLGLVAANYQSALKITCRGFLNPITAFEACITRKAMSIQHC